MKRFLSLIFITVLFASCQEDLKSNTPGFQGLKDDVFWRANDARAYLSSDGKLSIEALTAYEQVTLSTTSPDEGIYIFGTVNTDNAATYTSSFNGIDLEYATLTVPGPVSSVAIADSGTGYTSTPNSGAAVATTGGTGSGLTVKVTANAGGNVIDIPSFGSRGNGYVAGDLIIVSGGNLNCKLRVKNVQNSNGQVEITEFDSVNMTVTGKFKFNAVNANNSPFGGPLLNFQYGEFYKVPIFPAL